MITGTFNQANYSSKSTKVKTLHDKKKPTSETKTGSISANTYDPVVALFFKIKHYNLIVGPIES